MNRTLTVSLALAAGLLGGTLSGYVTPATVLAQAQPAVPNEIRAQRFTLVDEYGAILGVFGIDNPPVATVDGVKQKGNATLRLFDSSGRETFRAGPPTTRLVGQK
jgi:hypothetical protein